VRALFPLLFNFALKYVIRKVEENREAFKYNETSLLLVYADDVNLLDENINVRKPRNSIDAGEEGLFRNTDRENVSSLECRADTYCSKTWKSLETKATHQNYIHKKNKSRLNS
jgi:hypothetical protein